MGDVVDLGLQERDRSLVQGAEQREAVDPVPSIADHGEAHVRHVTRFLHPRPLGRTASERGLIRTEGLGSDGDSQVLELPCSLTLAPLDGL
jgi:hypothetical protein